MTPVTGHVIMIFWCGHEIHLYCGDYLTSTCPKCRKNG